MIALLIISAIAKGMCDRINFLGNFKSDWMIGAGKYHYTRRSFLMKYILSFISDGWHFFDAIRVFSLCMVIALYLDNIYLVIPLYIIHGVVFEILYRIK